MHTSHDGYIYHYTSVQAVQGILDNEQFWASNNNFLNDSKEFKYTYDLFEKCILNNISNTAFRKNLVDTFRAEISKCEACWASLSEVLNGYYVISFSTNPDNLVLWSEYANSMGYNLEFRFADLLKLFPSNNMWHGKVVYNKEIQLQCLQQALDESLTWRPEYRVSSINDFDEQTPYEIIAYLAMDMYVFCTVYSMFFKQPEFASEEEYRFVFFACHESNEFIKKTSKMYFRVKEDALIPYIKIPCKTLDALNAITIGPKNNIDIAMAGLKHYCREKRIEIPVLKSNIPLRY